MIRKILSIALSILFIISPVLAADGNIINEDEYPDSDMVLPNNSKDDFIIEGGVAKYLDVTLEDCMKFALGNNPRIQAAMQDVFASDYRIKQAWSNWFPTFSWQTGYSRIKQLQLSDALSENLVFDYYLLGSISLSEMLYDFGVTQNLVTIKKLENEQYKIILTETVNTVLRDVKNAYYNVLLANEQAKVAEENVERYGKFYNQAKAYYVVGLKPKIDVTIAEVNLSSAKLQLIEAENAVDIAMAKLNNTMGLPYMIKYNMLDELKFINCDISLDKAVNVAIESRPDFKLADVKVQTANQNVKLSKKSWYPALELDLSYSRGGKTFVSNYGYNIGGYLNFPAINAMLIRNEIKEAQSKHKKEIATSHQIKNDIYLEIQNAYYTMIEKKNKIPVSELQVKQAKENYELAFGRYESGIGDPIELKDAQVQYSNAKLSYNNTLYNYNVARADLEKAIGRNIINGAIDLPKTELKQNDKQKTKVKDKIKCKENKPVVKEKHYKNKFIKGLHNFFSYPDDYKQN